MRFGLIFTTQTPERWHQPHGQTYRAAIEDAVHAESLGFDYAMFGEHHFLDDGFCSQPLTMAAAVAARTTRIKVGTSVYLVPLHHPLELAEQAAVIDNLSDGRLVLGLGVGYVPGEFEAFGVEKRRRGKLMDENLERVLAAWGPDGTVTPRPVTPGGPEVWLGVTSRPALERAARFDLVPFYAVGPTAIIERQQRLYERACREHGREPRTTVPIVRETFVAESWEQAWELGGEHLMHTYRNDYRVWSKQSDNVQNGVVVVGEDGQARVARDLSDPVFEPENFARDRLLIGSPEQIRAEIEVLRERLGVTDLLLRLHHPGLPQDVAQRSVELFANEVMPAFRTQGDTHVTTA